MAMAVRAPDAGQGTGINQLLILESMGWSAPDVETTSPSVADRRASSAPLPAQARQPAGPSRARSQGSQGPPEREIVSDEAGTIQIVEGRDVDLPLPLDLRRISAGQPGHEGQQLLPLLVAGLVVQPQGQWQIGREKQSACPRRSGPAGTGNRPPRWPHLCRCHRPCRGRREPRFSFQFRM